MHGDLGLRALDYAQMSYASAKGKTPHFVVEKLKPLPELSDAEKEEIAGRVRLVKEHLPEAMDFIKALHAEELVDGLRCLASVTVFERNEHGLDG